MAHDDRISLQVRTAQQRIFRLAERDHGLSIKAIGLDSGIPYNTVRSYASGEVVMSVAALLKLTGVIPDHLLSHLLDPVGKCIVEAPEDGDHDTLAIHTQEFAGTYTAARHPNSPAGVDIAPCEDSKLRIARAKLRRVA